jgi:hypothetical protein
LNEKDRGYGELLRVAKGGINKIFACFLSPSYHTEINKVQDDIRNALNAGQDKITYNFLEYDHAAVVDLAGEL